MQFEGDRVRFEQSFFNGQMVCFTRGVGTVMNLTDTTFEMHDYRTVSNSCNLGIFIGQDLVEFMYTFSNEQMSVRLDRTRGEDYCFTRD